MHHADKRIAQWVNLQLRSRQCDRLQATIALEASADLKLDAADYSYSGLITLCEAIASMKRRGYSWGTVKAYYATFYLLRAYLATRNVAIFFRDDSYWFTECIDSAELTKTVVSSHASVIETVKRQSFSRNILQEEDNGLTIADRLKRLREEANYVVSPMSDPEPLPSVKALSDSFRASQIIGQYGRDPTSYAYTEGHALLAFPIFVWTKIKEESDNQDIRISFNEIQKRQLLQYIEAFNCKHEFELRLLNLD